MTSILQTDTQRDLLARSHFEPVFNERGDIIDIRELKVATDRRSGMEAMRELFASEEPNDSDILSDGWTRKQKRILSSPAPLAAHYLKPSRKWDAKTGDFRDSVLIILPIEVVWTMFELLFEGQYSVEVRDVCYETEEVAPVGTTHRNTKADDAPGRLFYARATVDIVLHLTGGQLRRYSGVGVAYSDLPMEKSGNIFQINSARRTAEKGAIADAKREALSDIGRVFRRAFEDGDAMIDHMEALLLREIQKRNQPAIYRKDPEKVPAPTRKSRPAAVETTPVETTSESATEVSDSNTATRSIHLPDGTSLPVAEEESFAQAFFDMAIDLCADITALDAFIDLNKAVLEAHCPDRSLLDDLRGQLSDEVPDFDIPPGKSTGTPASGKDETPPACEPETIDHAGKKGSVVLKELKKAIDRIDDPVLLDRFVEVNGPAIRKLTTRQADAYLKAHAARKADLSA